VPLCVVGTAQMRASRLIPTWEVASVGLKWMLVLTLGLLVVGGLIASTADQREATTGAVYASLFLPLAFMSGRTFDRWELFIVFAIAVALAAAGPCRRCCWGRPTALVLGWRGRCQPTERPVGRTVRV
jgi:hypothetical protein